MELPPIDGQIPAAGGSKQGWAFPCGQASHRPYHDSLHRLRAARFVERRLGHGGCTTRLSMRVVASSVLVLSCCFIAFPGSAQVQALGEPGHVDQENPIRGIRAAVALGARRTTTWVSFEVGGAPQNLVVILKLRPGERVDWADDAWFTALEATTSPKIFGQVPARNNCGNSLREEDTASKIGFLRSPLPRWSLVDSSAALQAFADSVGSPWAAGTSLDLSPAEPALVVAFPVERAPHFTPSLRWVTPESGVPLLLDIPGVHAPIPLTLWSLAPSFLQLEQREAALAHDLELTWLGARGKSDYRERTQELLSQPFDIGGPGLPRSLIEYSSRAAWSGSLVLPSGRKIGAIPDEYLENSQLIDETDGAKSECSTRFRRILVAKGQVGPACAEGALASQPSIAASGEDSDCDVLAAGASVHPDTLRCSGADELAFATSGQSSSPVVVRHSALIESGEPLSFALSPSDLPSQSAEYRANGVQLDACLDEASSSEVPARAPSSSSNTPSLPSYLTTPSYPSNPGYSSVSSTSSTSSTPTVSTHVVIEIPASRTSVSDGDSSCSGSSAPDDSGDSSCNGSSGSSYDGETCGGSSQDSGDGCSGSTDEDSSDGCGSSSKSSSDEESCSGNSENDSQSCSSGSGGSSGSSGYQGETCSGGSGGSGGSSSADCSVAPRPRRMRLSWIALLGAALALPLRRVNRSHRRTTNSRCR